MPVLMSDPSCFPSLVNRRGKVKLESWKLFLLENLSYYPVFPFGTHIYNCPGNILPI